MNSDNITTAGPLPDDQGVVPCSSVELRQALRRAGWASRDIKELLEELRTKASKEGWVKAQWDDCAIRCIRSGKDYTWEASGSLLRIARR